MLGVEDHPKYLTYVLGILSQNPGKICNLGKFALKNDQIDAIWLAKWKNYAKFDNFLPSFFQKKKITLVVYHIYSQEKSLDLFMQSLRYRLFIALLSHF